MGCKVVGTEMQEVRRHQLIVASERNEGVALPGVGQSTRQRSLLLIGPSGSVSAAFVAAVECEFRFLSFVTVSGAAEACAYSHRKVDLVLIAEEVLDEVGDLIPEIRKWHPDAAFAVIGDFKGQLDEQLRGLLRTRNITGVLPQSVNLEILLSSISILLRGGEYVPFSMFSRSLYQQPESTPEPSPAEGLLATLTPRECQILGKVATGSQNKTIAYELGLSEHTIKVHLHNIITKLGVHNRTEAAALYRDGLAQRQFVRKVKG